MGDEIALPYTYMCERASNIRLLSPILYYEKIAATCDTRHVAATCDSDGRYTILSQVQCNKWKTHIANAQLATWVSHVAMHAVAKVEPGSTFAMSRCDSLQQPATGVSPVAKLVATHVAAIFHSINRALLTLVTVLAVVKELSSADVPVCRG